MKSGISIFLLSLYLLSATEVYQLLKLPMLLEHFIEHKKEKTDMSFGEFLKIHYGGKTEYDQDYEKDMKLPFKMHNDFSDKFVAVYSSAGLPSLLPYFSNLTLQIVSVSKLFFVPTAYFSAIWQPPRFN